MPPREEKLKFTKDQYLSSLCRICTYPENPVLCCDSRRAGGFCIKVQTIAKAECRRTSLENEVIMAGH